MNRYNTIIKLEISFILIILLFFSFPLNLNSTDNTEINLKKIETYPKDEIKDYYFESLNDVEIYDKRLFAAETFANSIAVFSVKGSTIKYIRSIGRRGQGPGDLVNPSKISIWNREISVIDNKAISFFKLDGTFLRKFRRFGGHKEYVYLEGLIYRKNANYEEPYLIDVFTKEGKDFAKYGKKYINVDPSKFEGANPFFVARILFRGNILTDGKHIYYLDARFGNILKYSLKGEMITNKSVVGLFGKRGKMIYKKNKQNYIENGINVTKTKGRYPSDFIFLDSYIYNSKIYLIGDNYVPGRSPNDYIEIIAIDVKTLNPIRHYKFNINSSDEIISFAVTKKLSSPLFLVSMATEQGYIIGMYCHEDKIN